MTRLNISQLKKHKTRSCWKWCSCTALTEMKNPSDKVKKVRHRALLRLDSRSNTNAKIFSYPSHWLWHCGFWCLFTTSSSVLLKQVPPIILCLAFTIFLYMSPHSPMSRLQQPKHFCAFNNLLFNLWQREKSVHICVTGKTGDIRDISSILGSWKSRQFVRIVH